MVMNVVRPPHAAALMAAGHGRPALRTDLSALALHARRDFRNVRDELGAQPHRIRRTGLPHVNGLGTGALQAADQKCADRQRQTADESN